MVYLLRFIYNKTWCNTQLGSVHHSTCKINLSVGAAVVLVLSSVYGRMCQTKFVLKLLCCVIAHVVSVFVYELVK